MSELDPRRDRVALVTGAGTGIGRAIASKFGQLGWRVAIGGRRIERLTETAAVLEQAGAVVREVQRMTLEEIFVANVMSSRKELAA